MSEYYEAHPMRMPRIPISLAGFPASGHDAVAVTLASLTGLRHANVLQLLEHEVGMDAAAVYARFGETYFQTLEFDCVRSALSERPPGIVALGDRALLDPDLREHVVTHSALVHIHVAPGALLKRIRAQLDGNPTRLLPTLRGSMDADDIAALLKERQSGYDQAMIQVDGTDRSAHEVAREIIGHFALWDDGPR